MYIDFETCIIIAIFQTSTLVIINVLVFSHLLGQSVLSCLFQLKNCCVKTGSSLSIQYNTKKMLKQKQKMGNFPLPTVTSFLFFRVQLVTLSNENIHNLFKEKDITQKTGLESLYYRLTIQIKTFGQQPRIT